MVRSYWFLGIFKKCLILSSVNCLLVRHICPFVAGNQLIFRDLYKLTNLDSNTAVLKLLTPLKTKFWVDDRSIKTFWWTLLLRQIFFDKYLRFFWRNTKVLRSIVWETKVYCFTVLKYHIFWIDQSWQEVSFLKGLSFKI